MASEKISTRSQLNSLQTSTDLSTTETLKNGLLTILRPPKPQKLDQGPAKGNASPTEQRKLAPASKRPSLYPILDRKSHLDCAPPRAVPWVDMSQRQAPTCIR